MKIQKLVLIMILFVSIESCSKSTCEETKNGDAICPAVYDPVYGCNNKTYSNSCIAESYGITGYVKGECK